ncbi:hypothetical protein [Kineosporia sp. R_H_3]|uniref:hypothetical protein n=1 Tax=Kineosporia sp. R_H_3 TaxID=1961848 RepID=UPI000B4A6057|nr:hypothetical protein [Kineosporia sp. R_H_3]
MTDRAELLPEGFVVPDREDRHRARARRVLAVTRSVVAALLVPVVVLVTVVGVTGTWVRDELLDTDRYVATVGPLAGDTTVQDDVAAMIASAVRGNLGSEVPEALRPDVEVIAGQAAAAFTRSPAFATLWADLNRAGHEQVARLLRGDDRPVPGVVVRDGTVTLDLAPAVATVLADVGERVEAQLRSAGVDVALQLPEVDLSVDVAQTAAIERARPWVERLDTLTGLAPWLLLGCTAAAVLLARQRLRLLVVLAIGVTLAMALLLLALRLGSAVAATALDALGVSDGVGPVVVDRLTAVLRRDSLVVGAAATVVALGATLAARLRRPGTGRRTA